MSIDCLSAMKMAVLTRFSSEFGPPARDIVKVTAWHLAPGISAVLQKDQPKRGDTAYVWLPYPEDGQAVPEIALEYPGESGRHSNTYASPGLKAGKPALRLSIKNTQELEETIAYLHAMKTAGQLPEVRMTPSNSTILPLTVNSAAMSVASTMKPRREAIPRQVQREVWQRDGGCCVQCQTRALLCFDHIVPFSRGGSNTIRNIQLLCESCNLSKGNRI